MSFDHPDRRSRQRFDEQLENADFAAIVTKIRDAALREFPAATTLLIDVVEGAGYMPFGISDPNGLVWQPSYGNPLTSELVGLVTDLTVLAPDAVPNSIVLAGTEGNR